MEVWQYWIIDSKNTDFTPQKIHFSIGKSEQARHQIL